MGYWDITGLVALVFTALVTPFEISLLKSKVNILFFVNRVVDLVFIADLCLQFFLVYEDESILDASKRWVTDQKKITRHYLAGWFTIDLVSCLVSAFDFVGLDGGGTIDSSTLSLLRALRLIKLFRLVKLTRLFRRWEKRLTFNYGTMALAKCVIYTLMTCHWCACAWSLQTVFVSDLMDTWRGRYNYCWLEGAEPPSAWQVDQLGAGAEADENGVVCSSPGTTWVAGYYLFMMTITSVGYGDMTAGNTYEQVVLTLLILFTALMWSQVISTFCLVLANANPADQEFYNGMDALNDFLSMNAVPKQLRTHLRTYFHETRGLRLQRIQHQLYKDMNPTLAAMTFLKIHGDALDNVWIMQNCSRETRFRFIDHMHTRVYSPGERTEHTALNIVKRGQAMYRGVIMKRHDVWGEDIVLSDKSLVRDSEAKALEYLEVLCCFRGEMQDLMEHMSPSDLKWVRHCAMRMALCRYVLRRYREEQDQLLKAVGGAKRSGDVKGGGGGSGGSGGSAGGSAESDEIKGLMQKSVSQMEMMRQETAARESKVIAELDKAAQREEAMKNSISALSGMVEALTAAAARRKPRPNPGSRGRGGRAPSAPPHEHGENGSGGGGGGGAAPSDEEDRLQDGDRQATKEAPERVLTQHL